MALTSARQATTCLAGATCLQGRAALARCRRHTSLPPDTEAPVRRAAPHRHFPRVQHFDAKKQLGALKEGKLGPDGLGLDHIDTAKGRGSLLCDLAQQLWGRTSRYEVEHEGCACNVAFEPVGHTLPEVAFVGKRDVGKSHILRQILSPQGVRIAKESSQPGNQSMINFYRVANSFRIVDTPGMGYTRESMAVQHRWQNAVKALAVLRPQLRHVYLLVEAKYKGVCERDACMAEFLQMNKIPFTIVMTRTDKIIGERAEQHQRLVHMSREERYSLLTQNIKKMQEETDTQHIPVILTAAMEGGKGLGALMYDITSRVTSHLPDSQLSLRHIERSLAHIKRIAPTEASNREHGEWALTESDNPEVTVDCDASHLITTQTEFLPPEDYRQAFFLDAGLQARPTGERSSVKMLTEREEAMQNDAYHPLIGTGVLKKYFPTLAEDYLHKNHAEYDPSVKPKAEKYFGMPLPVDLRMKYATPEEKIEWRKRLNKPF
eukprot:Rhum_TRINITY_DN9147_c0_g1::Rhum_TRINITY_DN9147_c0_g1_i1::g.31840::m.31840